MRRLQPTIIYYNHVLWYKVTATHETLVFMGYLMLQVMVSVDIEL